MISGAMISKEMFLYSSRFGNWLVGLSIGPRCSLKRCLSCRLFFPHTLFVTALICTES